MGPRRAWATTLLVAGVLGGCGGTAEPVARLDGSAPSGAQALAFARAVNLRATDAPSMTVDAREKPAPRAPGELAFARCEGGVSPADFLVDMRSALFWVERGHRWSAFRSRVAVMRSEALARRNVDALASARGVRCATEPGVSVSSVALALPDGARAVGLRFVVPANRNGKHQVTYKEMLAFVSGPAEVEFTAAGTPDPVSPQTEQTLLALLHRRATAARATL